MDLYPLLMAPSFRHGAETPWGGHMLRDAMMKDAPADATGESLEVSVLPGHESTVANGAHAGQTLTHMVELWGEKLTGRSEGDFPLLLKILDPVTPLSVQVHPDDAYAQAHENRPCGKTEAWIVLNAEPGSRIVYGVDTKGESLEKIVQEGRIEECLRWQNVRPGDVYYIPSGMIHTLGEGVLVYEIQESCDLTYRFWDWDRVDEQGNRRELRWGEESMTLNAFDSVLVPAALEGVSLVGETKVLMSSLPDQEALRKELGYRAENVAGLMD